jgi:Uma2 family endonuclease
LAAADADNEVTEAMLLDRPLLRVPASAGTLAGFRAWVLSKDWPEYVKPCFVQDTIYLNFGPEAYLVEMPVSALTLEGFLAWVDSDTCPDRGRISFLNQEVLIDMSPEEIETHSKPKGTIYGTLFALNAELDLGELYPDGVQIAHLDAGVSNEPDALLVKWESFESGRVRLIPRKGRHGQYMVLEGTPDWVLEILSLWSATKDKRLLREAYHRARIPEYWLIDAQGKEIVFQILQWRRSGYVAVTPRDGWHKSRVFGRSFRLTRRRNRAGRWEYTLEVKPV